VLNDVRFPFSCRGTGTIDAERCHALLSAATHTHTHTHTLKDHNVMWLICSPTRGVPSIPFTELHGIMAWSASMQLIPSTVDQAVSDIRGSVSPSERLRATNHWVAWQRLPTISFCQLKKSSVCFHGQLRSLLLLELAPLHKFLFRYKYILIAIL